MSGYKYTVTCPTCGAEPEKPCRALTSGRVSDSHVARRNAQYALPRRRCAVCGVDLYPIDFFLYHSRLDAYVCNNCPKTDVKGEDIRDHAVLWHGPIREVQE